MRLLLVLAAALLAAGCVASPAAVPEPSPVGAVGALNLAGGFVLHNGGAAGGMSYLHLAEGDSAAITFPEGVLVQDAQGRLVPAIEPVLVENGGLASYLAPYGAKSVRVSIQTSAETRELELQLAEGSPFVSGDLAVELLKVQRDRFPHRTPGMESYAKSTAYFAEYFQELGYEVEVSDYPAVQLPVGSQPGGASLNSVVAYKRGTDLAGRYIVFGGHFDVVEETTEGAFDNTAGTVATLALAKAFQNVTTSRTIVFAAWGGEEDGILGSQAWLLKHPELVPYIDLYVNYDVTALAWPAPATDPAPVVVATGPDAQASDALAKQHAELESVWMQTGAEFVYEPVVQGQATGAGVDAQSDHTPFMARGIPSVFQFTGRVSDVFGLIHSERDTTENMTKYALKGPEGIDTEFTPEEMAQGEAILADSFETQMVAGFYWAVLVDGGVLPSLRADPGLPAPPLAPGLVA